MPAYAANIGFKFFSASGRKKLLIYICKADYRLKVFSARIIEVKWHVRDLVEQLLEVVSAVVARRPES